MIVFRYYYIRGIPIIYLLQYYQGTGPKPKPFVQGPGPLATSGMLLGWNVEKGLRTSNET